MKIAITATDKNLNASVDPRFGRCKYFLIIDSETKAFESINNQAMQAQGGAGIKAAQAMVNHGVDAVVTGNIGPNAFDTLSAAHIRVFTNASGTVEQALQQWSKGALSETQKSTVGSHAGMQGGR